MKDSRFLNYLRQIMITAADGHGDIAILSALVLPDILGQYLAKNGIITASESSAAYKECLRQCICRDKKRYGFSRLHALFCKSENSQKESSIIADELYKLRCSLAHGGNISIPNRPGYVYLYDPNRMPFLTFCGKASVFSPNDSGCTLIDIGQLMYIMCDMFSYEYTCSCKNTKRYLDDFNRNVRNSVSEALLITRNTQNNERGSMVNE